MHDSKVSRVVNTVKPESLPPMNNSPYLPSTRVDVIESLNLLGAKCQEYIGAIFRGNHHFSHYKNVSLNPCSSKNKIHYFIWAYFSPYSTVVFGQQHLKNRYSPNARGLSRIFTFSSAALLFQANPGLTWFHYLFYTDTCARESISMYTYCVFPPNAGPMSRHSKDWQFQPVFLFRSLWWHCRRRCVGFRAQLLPSCDV